MAVTLERKAIFVEIFAYMVLSMTGFGQAQEVVGNQKFSLELKSLNGKATDVRLKVPSYYKDKEMIVRRTILTGAMRGKIEANLSIVSDAGDDEFGINAALYKKYFNELLEIHQSLDAPTGDLASAILRIPNVVSSRDEEISDEEWRVVQSIMVKAIDSLNGFRADEGKAMYDDLMSSKNIIADAIPKVAPFEEDRIERLKERLNRNLNEFKQSDSVDQNRFEQEMIYYLEKLDINEEKVRLSQHCVYFEEVINNSDLQKGKKLAFIAQEMGREINTLGAKAQHSEMQQVVVTMKEALEKIKEQVLNIV